jgi:hypothetical protein
MTSLGVGGGVIKPSLSPTPRLIWSCTYARLFLPAWSRGNGGVQLDDFTWCMGAWPPPHPSIGSRTRATIRQYNFQFLIIISNLNVKIDFQSKLCPYTWAVQTSNQILIFKLKFQYYGSSPGYFLRLMFVYTTRDIYLTLNNIQI